MNGLQLVLIEISEVKFEELVTSGALPMEELVMIERYHQGVPEITANLRLIAQKQKEATTGYSLIMREIDAIKAKNEKLKI